MVNILVFSQYYFYSDIDIGQLPLGKININIIEKPIEMFYIKCI